MSKAKDYNFKPLPDEVFLKGKPFKGEASFVNGYNGHTKTEDDSILCALIDNSCWKDGKPNALTNADGDLIHYENRRGQSFKF